MSRQRKINEKMRRVLVDWLVRVHHSFSLQQETLYLSISIMDRYLAVRVCGSILSIISELHTAYLTEVQTSYCHFGETCTSLRIILFNKR